MTKTIYPTKDESWLIDGKAVDVKRGKPVEHPNDAIANALVGHGKASFDPPES